MTGILGIWNTDGMPVERELLTHMSSQLRHRGPDGESKLIRGSAGFACQLLRVTPESKSEIQPLVSASGGILVWDGRLDNRDELIAMLDDCSGLDRASPDASIVMAAYQVFGEGMPERLKGDFALGLFDAVNQRLLMARDAVGLRSLHYWQSGQTFVFASEIKAILAHPGISAVPNDRMLAQVVLDRGLWHEQSETCFKDVHSIPPGFLGLVTPRGLHTRRYWDFDVAKQLRFSSLAQYAEAFGEHFERSVRRRIRSAHPVGVWVSGGLDSSAIFCTAETLRRRQPVTVPKIHGLASVYAEGTPADERSFLDDIDFEYGSLIERQQITDSDFVTGAREEVWHVEVPSLDSQWGDTQMSYKRLKREGVRSLLTGHWGDQMLVDQTYLADLAIRMRWRTVGLHLLAYEHWSPDVNPASFRRLLAHELTRRLLPSRLRPSLRRLRSKLKRSDDSVYSRDFRVAGESLSRPLEQFVGATAHAKALYCKARSGVYVMAMESTAKVAAMNGMEIAFPFLDRDLIEFIMAIPGECLAWNGRHKVLLRESMRGIVPSSIVDRRGKADFTHLVNESAFSQVSNVLAFLRGGAAVRHGYVRSDAISRCVSEVNARSSEDARFASALRGLYALELWLQLFIDPLYSRET